MEGFAATVAKAEAEARADALAAVKERVERLDGHTLGLKGGVSRAAVLAAIREVEESHA